MFAADEWSSDDYKVLQMISVTSQLVTYLAAEIQYIEVPTFTL